MITYESVIPLVALIAGPWAFVAGFRALRIKRLIESTPTSNLRSVAMGLVEVQGAAGVRSRNEAPFSGVSCAYWEIEIQTRSSQSRNGQIWQTVHRDRSGHPFYLRDATGVALVYPQGALCRTRFAIDQQTQGPGVPEPYASYLAHCGRPMARLWAFGPMRFRELRLDDGQAAFVLGHATPPPRAVEVNLSDDALAATGTDAVGASRVQEGDAHLSAVIRRGSGDPVFIISEQSEKSMTLEYGLKAFAGAIGGPLITLFGVWCAIQLFAPHASPLH